jgi:phenylacetic acid degradation operon negative regulatory protein
VQLAPTAKSLILDLLSTLRRGAMPVRALVAAGALFAIEENQLRVALARLHTSGLVERDERGRYRLGTAAESVRNQIASWRDVEDRVRPWSGAWVGVLTTGLPRGERSASRRTVKQCERALRFTGFRELSPGLEVRPDNLEGGVAALRERLVGFGLPVDTAVFRLDQLDPAADERARGLWDARGLEAAYRAARTALERSTRRLAALPSDQQMRESFMLGGGVLRQIVLDPLLPEPIVHTAERAALVAAMLRYDAAGRASWAAFMSSFGVVRPHTPAALPLGDVAHRILGHASEVTL